MGALSLSARKNAKAQRAQWSSRLWSQHGDRPRHPTIFPPKGSALTPSDNKATLSPSPSTKRLGASGRCGRSQVPELPFLHPPNARPRHVVQRKLREVRWCTRGRTAAVSGSPSPRQRLGVGAPPG